MEVGFVRMKNSHRRGIPENVFFSGTNEKLVASDRKEVAVNAEINGAVVLAFVIVSWVFLAVRSFFVSVGLGWFIAVSSKLQCGCLRLGSRVRRGICQIPQKTVSFAPVANSVGNW